MYLVSRGSGYPILFIHGIPTSSQLWGGIIDKLLDRFTCHAVDLPGLGRTPRAPYGSEPLEAFADRIEQIRVEHNIDKWHVVGHDAGSAIAVHYAYRFQDRVDRLALLSPAFFPDLKPYHLFRILRQPVLGELLAPAVNAIFWKVAMRFALEQKRCQLGDVVDDRLGRQQVEVLLVPTLIFQGSRDRAIPQGFAQRASALIPQSEVVMVDSGHFIPLHSPEVVAAELLRFFAVDGNGWRDVA